VAGWLGAAVLATGVTLAAVSSIGAGIFGSSAGPLDRQEIAAALSSLSPSASASPPHTATASPSPEPTVSPGATEPGGTDGDAAPTVIASAGGTVVARCAGDGLVEVLSWSPAQGFRVDNAEHGPAREVELEFESSDDDIEVKVRCVDGVPTDVEQDDD
jgi:hypothetical protein